MSNYALETLQWKKFKVGSDGFVCLVDVMGTDASICQAASVSYGADSRDGEDNLKPNLIRYLMRQQHTTPFEMCEVKLLVRVPMDCWRQWIRHRTANVNEYSTRYKSAIDSFSVTRPDQWRLQSTDNKQGSNGYAPPDHGGNMSATEYEFHNLARQVYEGRLNGGIAREQARKDLPLSTYTEAYWKCDLHNIFNFLRLRMDGHAQQEIREYATIIGNEIIKPLFPVAWQAFEDYVLNSIKLSALEIKVIQTGNTDHITDKREKEECQKKLEKLKLQLLINPLT